MEIYTPSTLASLLSDKRVLSDFRQCKMMLSKVMLLTVDNTVDLSPLVSPMINLLAHSDLVIKKTACHFLSQVSHAQMDLMLLAVNTLLKDFEDSNPVVRGQALKTLCSVQHEAFTEHSQRILVKGLEDSSGFVRRIAVMACLTLTVQASDTGIVDTLYSMIRDTDPVVVVNCVMVLEEILQDEGGIVVSRSMAHYLLNKLSCFTTWGVVYILRVLKKYRPKSEEEIFDIMNVVDVYLHNNSCSVVIQTLEIFLSLTKDMPHMTAEIYKRCYESLLSVLSSGNVEMTVELMKYLESHLKEMKPVLMKNSKVFYCRHKDPGYLKQQKLRLLVGLVCEENVEEIFEEISMYCTDGDQSVSLCAISALPQLADICPGMVSSCFSKISQLLDSDRKHVLSNVLQVMVKLKHKLPEMEKVISKLVTVSQHVTDDEGKCAILSLIGQYGNSLPDSTYILEDFVENFTAENSVLVKSQLLLTAVQLFCQKPGECQGILGNLLELCMKDECHDLQDQAAFYYSLIQNDASVMKTLLDKP